MIEWASVCVRAAGDAPAPGPYPAGHYWSEAYPRLATRMGDCRGRRAEPAAISCLPAVKVGGCRAALSVLAKSGGLSTLCTPAIRATNTTHTRVVKVTGHYTALMSLVVRSTQVTWERE